MTDTPPPDLIKSSWKNLMEKFYGILWAEMWKFEPYKVMKTFAIRHNFVLKSIDQPLKTKDQESEMVSNFQEYCRVRIIAHDSHTS